MSDFHEIYVIDAGWIKDVKDINKVEKLDNCKWRRQIEKLQKIENNLSLLKNLMKMVFDWIEVK